MSCQSLSLAPADTQPLSTFHRTVHFSTDGESKCLEAPREADLDRGISSWCGGSDKMTRSAPAACGSDLGNGESDGEGARFPRLEECAHFHYGRVRLGGLTVKALSDTLPPHNDEEDAGWVTVSVHPHSEDSEIAPCEDDKCTAGMMSTEGDSNSNHWLLTRSAENFKMLDTMLHRCIYDRKVSGLPDLNICVDDARSKGSETYMSLISDYLHHFSIIADDSINCGPILNWFQMDNKGHRLLVASEDTNSINTPAVAAAYSVRRYVSQARDEISFEVGDMISVIDMPGPSESTWWRGKRGFKVGFFPQQCVAVIGDKIPRNMKEPPPIVGSVAVAPIKPVLRKHGKLISLFRSFILSRPSRRSLRQQGILKERVFGCDLGEHLLNSGHNVPMVLSCCAKIIEQYGCVDGIYRLSGASSTTQRLRIAFDEERLPPLDQAPPDVHAVASLLKMYFRELPNPLCTYQLYGCFVNAVQGTSNIEGEEEIHPRRLDDAEKLLRMRETVVKLPPPHYRTLAFLMRHLHRMSLLGSSTGMTARNMAIVWAPNLLRSPVQQHALQGVAVQAVVTEFLICYADLIFSDDQSQLCQMNITPISCLDQPDSLTSCSDFDGQSIKRPKSLPLQTPTKLLSLEEARSKQQLRPSVSREPQYIEVGGGPNSLPRYHTIIQLPSGSTKRGLKRSPSGWRGLFFRASKHRPRATASSTGPVAASSVPTHVPTVDLTSPAGVVVDDIVNCKDTDSSMAVEDSRTARSCESLLSEGDSLPPLSVQPDKLSTNHHNRSVSCDSYFEASLAELAGMRLRLTSQEREMDIFSEDDTTKQIWNKDAASSADTSVEPSPTKLPRTTISKVPSPLADNRKRTKLEDQLSDLLYIDCSTPEHKTKVPESGQGGYISPNNEGDVKRLCKDTSEIGSKDSSIATSPQSQSLAVKVKMRDRGSPRRASKGSISRHSHCGTPPSPKTSMLPQRHSTLIQVDWPHQDTMQPTSLDCYAYSQLQSDSEGSLPVGESRDSLARRLIESKESLMSRSNETDSLSVVNVGSAGVFDKKSCVGENSSDRKDSTADMLAHVSPDVATVSRDAKEGATDPLLDNRNSGHFVDWSDGMMDSSMERSTISSDLDKSYDGKKHSPDKASDYEGFEVARASLISSSEEAEHDFSKRSDEMKLKKDKFKANRCSVTVTPSEENCSNVMMDSLEESLSPVNISYQNLNRLSNMSNDSLKTGTSKESTPTLSPLKDREKAEEIYECFSFARPSYINLVSSGESNTPGSPPQLKSPIKSTISITFKSPTKENPTCTSDEMIDSKVYEQVEAVAETAAIPQNYNANLPTQEACQPQRHFQDLILLDTPVEEKCVEMKSASNSNNTASIDVDIYNQVKFFRQSVNEVNSLILESDDPGQLQHITSENKSESCYQDIQIPYQNPPGIWYENVSFVEVSKDMLPAHPAYENLVLNNVLMENKGSSEMASPVLSLCLDRNLLTNKPIEIKKNTYENYTAPSAVSSHKECASPKHESVELRKVKPQVKLSLSELDKENSADNGNTLSPEDKIGVRKSTTSVRQLANKFESPTENVGPFSFDRYIKSGLSPTDKSQGKDRNKAVSLCEPRNSPNTRMTSSGCINNTSNNKFNKCFTNTRSLDENAFIKEFGKQKECLLNRSEDECTVDDRRKSLEAGKSKFLNQPRKLPDLNLNLDYDTTAYSNKGSLSLNLCDHPKGYNISESKSEHSVEQCASVTPTTENKICLVQARLSPKRNQRHKNCNFPETTGDLSGSLSTSEMSLDQDKKNKLSRERIERYKEERRLFLREKYSPHSFRGVGDLQLSYKSSKDKSDDYEDVSFDGVELRNPNKVLERRNTADAAHRMKYANVLSTNRSGSGDNSDSDAFPVTCKGGVIEESPNVTELQKKFSVDSKLNVQSQVSSSWHETRAKPNTSSFSDQKQGHLKDSDVVAKSTSYSGASSDSTDFGNTRKEKRSPSFNIRDMAAKFEQRTNP